MTQRAVEHPPAVDPGVLYDFDDLFSRSFAEEPSTAGLFARHRILRSVESQAKLDEPQNFETVSPILRGREVQRATRQDCSPGYKVQVGQIWRSERPGFYSILDPCLAWVQREQKAATKEAKFGAHFTQIVRFPAFGAAA